MKNKIINLFFFTLYSFIIVIILYLLYLNKISDIIENNKYLVYIFVLTSILLILIIYKLFFFNINSFKNFLLLFITSTLSIISLEIIIEYLEYKKKINLRDASISKNVNLKKLYSNLLKKNENLKFSFSPNQINIDLNKNFYFSNNSNSKSFLCIEDSGPIIINNDKFGFHNDNLKWLETETILFLGDSFVQGWCVNSKNNFVNKFNKKSLNLGVQNTGPLIQYAILKEYLKYIKPKKIIWFYYEGNDYDDLNHEKRKKILREYLTNKIFSQQLIKRQSEVDTQNNLVLKKYLNISSKNKKKEKENYSKHFNLKNIITLRNIRTFMNNIFFKGFLYEKILVETKKLTELYNVELIMVYLPSYERYKFKNNFIKNIHYKQILKIYEKNGLNVVDLKKDFFDKTNTLELYPQKKRGHLNIRGHKELSEFLKINIR